MKLVCYLKQNMKEKERKTNRQVYEQAQESPLKGGGTIIMKSERHLNSVAMNG